MHPHRPSVWLCRLGWSRHTVERSISSVCSEPVLGFCSHRVGLHNVQHLGRSQNVFKGAGSIHSSVVRVLTWHSESPEFDPQQTVYANKMTCSFTYSPPSAGNLELSPFALTFSLLFTSYLLFSVCPYVGGASVPQHTCGGHQTTFLVKAEPLILPLYILQSIQLTHSFSGRF